MSFIVTIQPSGHQFTCEDDETVLEAALRQGYAMPYGCRNGACGSCLGNLLQGEVDYGATLPPAINEKEMAEGKALFCQALPMSDLEIEVREIGAAKDIVIKTLPVRVLALNKLNHDVMEMRLKLPATERLQFLAGQYIDILLKDGRRRSFSLANPPHHDEYLELHLRHVPGGSFTDHVFQEMKEKALLRIEGPLGTFFLREDSERPVILVAGGTGFAPIKAIVEHAVALGDTRPMILYWGVRTRKDLYMAGLAQSWADEYAHISFVPVLSQPEAEDDWTGRSGFVHEAVVSDHADLSGFDVYMAGPPPMIRAAREAFLARALPSDHLYSDSFDYSADARKAADG